MSADYGKNPYVQQSPCNQRAKLHLGQYGDSIAGIANLVSDFRRESTPSTDLMAVNIFRRVQPSGRSRSLRNSTLLRTAMRISACNPCKCDDFEVRLELGEDDQTAWSSSCVPEIGTFYPIRT